MNIFPPIAFVVFLVLAFLFGLGSRRMAPKALTEKDAETSYAGGEDIPGEKKISWLRILFRNGIVLHRASCAGIADWAHARGNNGNWIALYRYNLFRIIGDITEVKKYVKTD